MLITDFEKYKNIPQDVYHGDIIIQSPDLTSLKNFPKRVMGKVSLNGCINLETLEYAPQYVENTFEFNSTRISSLQFVPRTMSILALRNTDVRTLENIHKQIDHVEYIYIAPTFIRSNVLGLMMIKDLKYVVFSEVLRPVSDIIHKHLKNPDIHIRVLECAEELIGNGFEEYAQL